MLDNSNFYNSGHLTGKPHKFFERFLNNDLEDLSNFLRAKYQEIDSGIYDIVLNKNNNEAWVESGSRSTVKWRDYNVFQFHHPAIFDLLKQIKSMVQEACDYYEIDFEQQKFMIQGWFNINKKGSGKLDWHEHGPGGAPNFHGYYAVNAEPSVTHYKLYNNPAMVKDNVNINNRAVLSEMGHPHAQGDWDWDGDRITIAYDISPLHTMLARPGQPAHTLPREQHWIPLV